MMADIDGELTRDVYISQIARELDIGKDRLLTTTAGIRKRRAAAAQKKAAHNLRPYAQDKAGAAGRSIAENRLQGLVSEEKLIVLFMQNPDYYDTIRSKICVEDFQNEQNRQIFAALEGRLREGRSIELIYLAAELSPEAMGKLSRLLADTRGIPFYPDQADTYIEAITAQKKIRSADEVGEKPPGPDQAYRTSLSAKKR
jgi:DNA primase